MTSKIYFEIKDNLKVPLHMIFLDPTKFLLEISKNWSIIGKNKCFVVENFQFCQIKFYD